MSERHAHEYALRGKCELFTVAVATSQAGYESVYDVAGPPAPDGFGGVINTPLPILVKGATEITYPDGGTHEFRGWCVAFRDPSRPHVHPSGITRSVSLTDVEYCCITPARDRHFEWALLTDGAYQIDADSYIVTTDAALVNGVRLAPYAIARIRESKAVTIESAVPVVLIREVSEGVGRTPRPRVLDDGGV